MPSWKATKIGKQAAKFQFVVTPHEVTLECVKGSWKPHKLAVSVYHHNRRYSTQNYTWEPTIQNPFRGKIVWTSSESISFTATLFREKSCAVEFEDKERSVILEEVEQSGRRRPLASVKVHLNLYAGAEPTQCHVIEELKPANKKVVAASLSVSYISTLLKEGKATDDDMQSISSLLSTMSRPSHDVGNLDDFDPSPAGTMRRKALAKEISDLASGFGNFDSTDGDEVQTLKSSNGPSTNGALPSHNKHSPSHDEVSRPLTLELLPRKLTPYQSYPAALQAEPAKAYAGFTSDVHIDLVPKSPVKSTSDLGTTTTPIKADDVRERARKLLDSARFHSSSAESFTPSPVAPVSQRLLTPLKTPTASNFKFYQFKKLDMDNAAGDLGRDRPEPSVTPLDAASSPRLNPLVDTAVEPKAEAATADQPITTDISTERMELENEQTAVDVRAVDVANRLRTAMEPGSEEDEEDILLEWMALVNKRNAIVRRLEQIKILEEQNDLQSRQKKIAAELATIREFNDWQRTTADRQRERLLIDDLSEIVKRRDQLVEELHAQEDAIDKDNEVALSTLQHLSSARNDQNVLQTVSAWSRKMFSF